MYHKCLEFMLDQLTSEITSLKEMLADIGTKKDIEYKEQLVCKVLALRIVLSLLP